MLDGDDIVDETERFRQGARLRAPDDTWITKDGRVLPVVDMTDAHLDNAIAYLERRGFSRKLAVYLTMVAEWRKRAERRAEQAEARRPRARGVDLE